MLDKSVPYISVIMLKENKDYPVYYLPPEYRFQMYKEGTEEQWAELEASVDEFSDKKSALEHFKKEYFPRKNELPQRMVFIRKGANMLATGTLWDGDHFGRPLPRIHWVSVHPEYQGRGLAKVLMAQLLNIHKELGEKYPIYLTTQTWSYKAINIYLQFGFKPYTEEKPAAWETEGSSFKEDNRKAWGIIYSKIEEYNNNHKRSRRGIR